MPDSAAPAGPGAWWHRRASSLFRLIGAGRPAGAASPTGEEPGEAGPPVLHNTIG